MKLTTEQEAIIHHPEGKHARILAVAGSGKTSTLVYRIKHLVEEKSVDPASIQVLMFNRLARLQFKQRLEEEGVSVDRQPKVDTFHSYAYAFINKMIGKGVFPGDWDYWFEEEGDRARAVLHRVISELVEKNSIPADVIDVEKAMEAINLWKGSLILTCPHYLVHILC